MSALGKVMAWSPLSRAPVLIHDSRHASFTRCKSIAAAKGSEIAARGALIVFEGIDRCGKSTQSSRIVEHLRSVGILVEHWRFPDRSTRLGQTIDNYLRNGVDHDDTAVHLLFTANRFEKRNEMLRLLADGTTIVCDRYSYSGVAYTAAKGLPLMDWKYCRALEVGLPAADLVVHMALCPELAATRGGFGSERYEKLEFQRKVAQQYEHLKDDRWISVDAAAPPEHIHQQVVEAAMQVVKSAVGGAPLGRLWDYESLKLPELSPAAAAAAVTAA